MPPHYDEAVASEVTGTSLLAVSAGAELRLARSVELARLAVLVSP